MNPNTQEAPADTYHIGETHEVKTRIGDREFDITSDDNYLDHIRGEFEPGQVRMFAAVIRSDDVVLDIGANIGCTSLLFGQLARQVYCFEPAPSTFELLRRNLHAGGIATIEPVNLGLGKEAGEFELAFSPHNRSGGFISNQIKASESLSMERIRVVVGDEWIRQTGIAHVDFIKIDVEGFERNVIEGLAETIRRDRPVVALELNHWCLNVFQRTSIPDFFDFLRGIFPILYAIDASGEVRDLHDVNDAYHVMYHHVVRNFMFADLIGGFDADRMQALMHLAPKPEADPAPVPEAPGIVASEPSLTPQPIA